MWWVKLIAIVLLIAAVVALARALMALIRGEGKDGTTMRALAWRIGLSIAVFLFILLSIRMGWVKPHDVNPTLRNGQPIQQAPAIPPGEPPTASTR